MRLETEFLLLGWGPVGAILANALFSERKRPEDRQPVGFWRAMEVLGLWAAAGVGLAAIIYSTRDSTEQVGALRDQLKVMSGQLDEMQQEGRPWVGPASAALVPKDRGEPLRVNVGYRNYGRQPATFVRNAHTWTWLAIDPPGKRIEDLGGWKDPKAFNPRAACETTSPHITVYPGDVTLAIEAGASMGTQRMNDKGQIISFQTVLDGIKQKVALYVVYGCFTYIVGERTQFTTFCLMWDPTINNDTDLSAWKPAFCPYGNDNGELTQDEANKQKSALEGG
jgi:hypothetical protein